MGYPWFLANQKTPSFEDEEDFVSWAQERLALPHQEAVIQLLRRWPDEFDQDFIQGYHHFLGLTEKEFRAHRSTRHQLRLLASLHLMRKKLLRKYPLAPHEVHIDMRLLPTALKFPFSQKPVVGILVAISLPTPYHQFGDRHILSAVQKLVPWTLPIPESFLSFQKPRSPLRLLYLEIEKNNGLQLTLPERALLKQNLSDEFKKCVETLSPSIFGNCDVEEVMRNIFSLSQELQTSHDFPQVMISFEGSSSKTLIFRIIVVRLLKKRSQQLVSHFQALNDESFEYVPERSSTIGYIGKRGKEATVFRLHLSKAPFLFRSDSSLNLFRAREHVYSLVVKALGEIRDFNGGIFSKQLEYYSEFRKLFPNYDPELLEDFFHSLNPPEMQAILPLTSVTNLFHLFLRTLADKLPNESSYSLHFQEKDNLLFATLRLKETSFQERLTNALSKAHLFQGINAWMAVKRYDGLILGYITQFSPEKKRLFTEILSQTLKTWAAERQNTQILRLDMQDFPVSLDPRLGGDDISGILLKMLFEGLMRMDSQGKPAFACAQQAALSEDRKRYTFTLRKCFWNNGNPITAHDFCYAWKKVLSPHFSTAFAYLFYVIKNAKQAKEGKISLDEIGIYAPNDYTLIVELERPCSYFLELTANPLYSPVNHLVDQLHPNWPLQTGQNYICNGPFYLETLSSKEIYILQKNPRYWDASSVQLNHIQISKATARKALEMFEKGEIDWLGRPSRPWERFFSNSQQKNVEKLSASVVCCFCNVQQFPLQSTKLRLALAYALDRQAFVDKLPEGRSPAFTPLLPAHSQQNIGSFKDQKRAKTLFEEALKELGLTHNTWPTLTLIHANNEVRKEIATEIVRQWKEVLGITIHLKGYDFRDLFSLMTQGKYQLGTMIWRTLVHDPLYTLEAFKHSTVAINCPKWEDPRYRKVLDQALHETVPQEKNLLLAKAESLLLDEMPLIPIFYETDLFVRSRHIKGEIVSTLGNIDFKNTKRR